MNKKMILLGVAALVGCFVLASFDKKTLAQQKEDIAQAVQAKLDDLHKEKQAACSERVQAEAQNRYQTWVTEEEAKAATKPGVAKKPVKKGTTGPKVDPLPATTAPAPTNPKQSKMDGNSPTTQEKTSKMEGAPVNTDKKKAKMGGGN